jgi:hypothetical protein
MLCEVQNYVKLTSLLVVFAAFFNILLHIIRSLLKCYLPIADIRFVPWLFILDPRSNDSLKHLMLPLVHRIPAEASSKGHFAPSGATGDARIPVPIP